MFIQPPTAQIVSTVFAGLFGCAMNLAEKGQLPFPLPKQIGFAFDSVVQLRSRYLPSASQKYVHLLPTCEDNIILNRENHL